MSILKNTSKRVPLIITLVSVIIYVDGQVINPEKTFTGHEFTVLSIDIDNTGKYLVSGSYDNKVILWDSKTGKQLSTYNGHNAGVWDVEISPGNSYVATGSWDNNRNAIGSSHNCLSILDLKTLEVIKLLSIFPDRYKTQAYCSELDVTTANGIRKILFNADGSKVAAITRMGDLFIWDMQNKYKELVYYFGESKHELLDLSPDWNYVICCERKRALIDTSFYLMRLGSEEVVARFDSPKRSVVGVRFSETSRYIASISGDRISRNEIDIWDTKTQKLLVTLKGHSSVVRSIAFSNDDKYLASAGEDNKVNLWKIQSGKLVVSFSENNDKEITTVIFSPDQKYLISGSQQSTISYWNIEDYM